MNTSQKPAEQPRIPMSLPHQKLHVPDIPGYHLHWIAGTPARLQQALAAGYEFVSPEETTVTNTGLANDMSISGNTDLGSRVSIVNGSDTEVSRLYLMKLREEYWLQDQAALAERNEQVAQAVRGGTMGGPLESGYVPETAQKQMSNLFSPKRRS